MPIFVKFDVILGKLREDDTPSGGGASIADLGNIFFVSMNGSDATGTKGRIDLPFQTINGAKATAGAGDLIYVFAGTYNEAGIQKNNVAYYFQPEAIVSNAGVIWDGSGGAVNVTVRGEGQFISTADRVLFNSTASNFDIECDYMDAFTDGVFSSAGYVRIKCRLIKAKEYCITLRNTSLADIFVQTADNTASVLEASGVFISNHSTDLIARKLNINIGKLLSVANGNFSAVTMANSDNCTVTYNGDIEHAVGVQVYVGGLFSLFGGKIMYSGKAVSGGGFGVTFVNLLGTVNNFEFLEGLIQTNVTCVRLSATATSYFKQYPNAVLNTTGDASVVELGVGGYIGATLFGNFESWGHILNNTNVIGIPPQCHGIRKEGVLPDDTVCRLNGCKIWLISGAGESLNNQDGNPQNIQIMSAYSNNNTTPLIFTNIIAGTNLIIDANLTDNPVLN